jgi:hypothetical protein
MRPIQRFLLVATILAGPVNAGTATLFDQGQESCGATNYNAATTADLNRDGLPDIVAADNGDGTLAVCMNRTGDDPGFAAPVRFPIYTPGQWPYQNITGVAAGDIDDDGRIDLVGVNGSSNEIAVLLNRTPDLAGDAAFDAPYFLPTANRAGPVALLDLDGEGRLDIVAGGMVGSCEPGGECESDVYLFRNETIPGEPVIFAALETRHSGMFVDSVAPADFNLDGRTDFAVASYSGVIDLFLNATPVPQAVPEFVQSAITRFDNAPRDLHVADFNGDGRPDIAVAHPAEVSILSNLTQTGAATASFAEPKTVYVAPWLPGGYQDGPEALASGDFNGDGRIDLAAGSGLVHNDEPGVEPYSALTVLMNLTPSEAVPYVFLPLPAMRVSPAVVAVQAADMNGDAAVDLVAAGAYTDAGVTVVLATEPSSAGVAAGPIPMSVALLPLFAALFRRRALRKN